MKTLTDHASLLVIIAAIAGYIHPPLFEYMRGQTQTLVLGFIMLTMGLTLTGRDFKVLAERPFDIVLGTIAQFTIMPFVAFGITRLLGLDTSVAIGLILVGCCPGGVSSNLMSFLCRGDVAFSVGMTTVSTLLAPFVTPALVLLLAGQSVDVDAISMFRSILLVTLLPISVGFGLNAWLGAREGFQKVRSVMPAFSVIALAFIVGGVVSQVKPDLALGGFSLIGITFLAVFCHNTLGYALGYAVGKIFHFSKAKNRTISIEVGMQNAGLATNLASQFFMAANPLSVVPCAISCAWHSISGTIIANMFASRDKCETKSADKPERQ